MALATAPRLGRHFPGLTDIDADPTLKRIRERVATIERRHADAEARIASAADAARRAEEEHAAAERAFLLGDGTDRRKLDAATKRRDDARRVLADARAAVTDLASELDRGRSLVGEARTDAVQAARLRLEDLNGKELAKLDDALHAASIANCRIAEIANAAQALGLGFLDQSWRELDVPNGHGSVATGKLTWWRKELVEAGLLPAKRRDCEVR